MHSQTRRLRIWPANSIVFRLPFALEYHPCKIAALSMKRSLHKAALTSSSPTSLPGHKSCSDRYVEDFEEMRAVLLVIDEREDCAT